MVTVVVAALQSGVLGRTGQAKLQWMKMCNMYGKFYNQMGEGITSDFVISLSVVVISFRERSLISPCLSIFNVYSNVSKLLELFF